MWNRVVLQFQIQSKIAILILFHSKIAVIIINDCLKSPMVGQDSIRSLTVDQAHHTAVLNYTRISHVLPRETQCLHLY